MSKAAPRRSRRPCLHLRENADEPQAALIAGGLAGRRFETTKALAETIRGLLPRLAQEERELSVRRVFQALRIAVNDEFSALDTFLRDLPSCLSPGGRVAMLSFHSGEDRRIKKAFAEGARAGVYAEVASEVVRPSPAERHDNPRSASTKMRWAVRAPARAINEAYFACGANGQDGLNGPNRLNGRALHEHDQSLFAIRRQRWLRYHSNHSQPLPLSDKSRLLKSLLIETIVYAVLVVAYFYLVLHFLGGWLEHLFERPHKLPYAAVALLLMLGQGVLLESTTTALLRFIRRRSE